MTCIAWDGSEMVSDSLCSAYGQVFSMDKKLYRLKSGAILGTAGDADCREIMQLLDLCETEADLPTKRELTKTQTSFQGLLWLPDRTMWCVDVDQDVWEADIWYGGCYKISGKKAVAGCGGGLAIAVMDAGLSAYEAVKIAIKRDLHCGGPIQRMTLDVPKPKKKKKVEAKKPDPDVKRWKVPEDKTEEEIDEAMKSIGFTQTDPEKEAIGQ